MSELEFINHTKLNFAETSDLSRKDVGLPMSDDIPRRFPSAFKGAASGCTRVRGGPRLYNQLADDRDRARPAPTLARLAWLERADPDSARKD
jgi:hypothetical protein